MDVSVIIILTSYCHEKKKCLEIDTVNWWFNEDGSIESHKGKNYDDCMYHDESVGSVLKQVSCDAEDANQIFISKTIPSYLYISNSKGGVNCLGVDDHGNLHSLPCDESGALLQQEWVYDLSTRRITNRNNNKCLDANEGTYKVNVRDCHHGLNQKWLYDGFQLQCTLPVESGVDLCLVHGPDDSLLSVGDCTGANRTDLNIVAKPMFHPKENCD